MINTVEKLYVLDIDGNLTNEFSSQYKVTYSNGVVSFVPHDEVNLDYQAIQEWIADGGTVIDNGGGE
jgi:hypothetical protein